MKETVVEEQDEAAKPVVSIYECGLEVFQGALALAGTVVSEKDAFPPLRSVLLARPQDGGPGFVVTGTDLYATTVEFGFGGSDATATGEPLLIDHAQVKQVLATAVKGVGAADKRTLRVRIELIEPPKLVEGPKANEPGKAMVYVGRSFKATVTCYAAKDYPEQREALPELADAAREPLAAAVAPAAKTAKAHKDMPALSCVSFAVKPGMLTVLGTDSARVETRSLAVRTTPGLAGEQLLLVESEPLAAALKLARGQRVLIGADAEGAVSFTCGDVRVTATPTGHAFPLAQLSAVLDVLPVAGAMAPAKALLGEVIVASAIAKALTRTDLVELCAGPGGLRVLPALSARPEEVEAPLIAASYEGPTEGVRRIVSGKLLEQGLKAFEGGRVGVWLQRPSRGLLLAEAERRPRDAAGRRHLLVGAVTAKAKADARLYRAEHAAAEAAGLAPKEDWAKARAELECAARIVATGLRRDGRLTTPALLTACRTMYADFNGLDLDVRARGLAEMRQLLAEGARLSTDRWSIAL